MTPSAPWISQYGNVPVTLEYPPLTMYRMVLRMCEAHPTLPAYEFMGAKTTYKQFARRLDRTARALYAIGIRKGDRVTICMPNMPQAVDTFYALNKLGAIANMVHPLSAPAEIAFYLRDADSRIILTLDQFAEKVVTAAGQLKERVTILVAQPVDELKFIMKIGYKLTQKPKGIPALPENAKDRPRTWRTTR